MSFFNPSASNLPKKLLLVPFSPNQDRAVLMSPASASGRGTSKKSSRQKQQKSQSEESQQFLSQSRRPARAGRNSSASQNSRSNSNGNSRKKSRESKVTVVNGRVALRVGGYQGIQTLRASQLVPHLPLNKLKLAAKKVLTKIGIVPQRKRVSKPRVH